MKKDSGLISRILTGAVVSAVITLCIVFSKYWWVLPILSAVLSFIGVGEVLSAAKIKKQNPLYWIACSLTGAAAFVEIDAFKDILIWFFIAAIIVFSALMLNLKSIKRLSPVLAAFLAIEVVAFIKAMVYIRQQSGAYILALAFLVTAVTDIMAYFVGRAIGKHKLAPVVSPKKTIEGSIGGSVCAVLLLTLISFILQKSGLISLNFIHLAIYLFLASLLGQFGDLSFSTFKRIAGVKDFGKILPGHGGILDRFDSVIFVLPFTFFYYLVI